MSIDRAKSRADLEPDAEQIVHRLLHTSASIGVIAREYNCATDAVCRIYSERTTARQREAARSRKCRAHPNHRSFSPGHVPWNRGRYCRLSPSTEFKAGCLRGHAARSWCPVGTVKVRDDHGTRCRIIKVQDHGPARARWIRLAVYRWQQAHGPVPRGRYVVCRDGDPLNDQLDNLVLCTAAERMALQFSWPRWAKARKKAGRAMAQVHATRRAVKQTTPRPVPVTWTCASCSADSIDKPARCPKCGASAFEPVRHAPDQEAAA